MLDHSYVAYDNRTAQWREVHAVRLGGRETQVLELLAKRLEPVVIASRLGITRRHVDEVCRELVTKLAAADVEHLRSISIQIYQARKNEQV